MVYYAILLFFVLEYVRPGSYFPALNAFHLNSIVPAAVLIGALVRNGPNVRISEILSSRNARWLSFLLLLLVISGVTCDVKMFAFDMFVKVLGYVFMYVFLRKEIYDLPRLKGVFTVLLFVHMLVGALTPEMFSGDGKRHYIASGGFLGDGNDFALSVNMAIPFCLFLFFESQRFWGKLLYGGILAVLVFCVVATQSRGGIIAMAAVGLYIWMKSDGKVLGVIGIASVIGFIVLVAPPAFFERMETMTQTGESMEGSAQGRIEAWKAGVRMATDHPLLGVGAGHFPVKYGTEYRPEGISRTDIPWQTAHSNYFVILGELGFPGLFFFVGMIIANFITTEQKCRQVKLYKTGHEVTNRRLLISLNASLIAYAVGGAFLTAIAGPHLFLLAALLECGQAICNTSLKATPSDKNIKKDWLSPMVGHRSEVQNSPVS